MEIALALLRAWWKPILCLLFSAAVGVFGAYEGWTHGEQHQQKNDVALLNKTTKSLQDTTAVLVKLTAVVKQQNAAAEQAKADSKKVEDDLQKKLTAALNHKPTIKTIIKEVPTYVTSSPGNGWFVTDGFVQLYNESIKEDSTALAAPYSPSGAGVGADTPTGIMPTHAATVIAYNNTQCMRWRDQLVTWQTWYASEKVIVDKINQSRKAP